MRLLCQQWIWSVVAGAVGRISTPRSWTTSTGLRVPESSCSIRSLMDTLSSICLEPNQINSVLSVFSCSLRDEHQLLMSAIQSKSVDRALWMSCKDMSKYACLSSACLTPCFLKSTAQNVFCRDVHNKETLFFTNDVTLSDIFCQHSTQMALANTVKPTCLVRN